MKAIEKQIEITSPMELYTFIDEHFDKLTEDVKSELLDSAGCNWNIEFTDFESVNKITKPEMKVSFGYTLVDKTKNVLPIMVRPTLMDKKLMAPLERPTTPEQLDYIVWLWEVKAHRWVARAEFLDIEYPDHAKKYLNIKENKK